MKQVRSPRLNAALAQNDLRDYLGGKRETGTTPSSLPRPKFQSTGKPLSHTPHILLIAPGLTIPVNMPKRCIPPLGLSYIAAMLGRRGFKVSIFDCCVEGYEFERVEGNLVTYGTPPELIPFELFAPDLIGVSVLFSSDLATALRVCTESKRRLPATPTVLGGLHPTIYPRQVFTLAAEMNAGVSCVDWIIRGEGEFRFSQFVEQFKNGVVNTNADGLAGILDGALFINPQIERIQDLDSLPFPAYHLLPMEKYFAINVPFSPAPKGCRVVQLLTSRGCPVGCSFCASTNMYKEYRHRSVSNIISEIDLLKSRYQIDEIQFADDNLTFYKQHTEDLLKALQAVKLAWCTPNGTMVNTLTPELLRMMVQAGLYQITISLDSGSARTLNQLHHKPVDLARIPELIETCKRLGVWTHGTLVVGMPGETLDDLTQGLSFVREKLAFNSISTFIASPIPGSELYHAALEKGLIESSEATRIDTTRCKMKIHEIAPAVLEETANSFQREFTERAIALDPQGYTRRYGRFRSTKSFTAVHAGRLT